MSLKRALVCGSLPPEFDRDSGSRRLLDLIDLLRDDGWRLVFLAASGLPRSCYTRNLQQRGVFVVDGSKAPAQETLRAVQFDLALFAAWSVAEAYLPLIRRASPRTRVIIDSVDLHFLRNARRCLQTSFSEAPGRLDERFSNEFIREINVYAAADGVLTVSQKEADVLNDLVGKPGFAQVVPDLEPRLESQVAINRRKGILFVGSFRHEPNVGAVEFLCKEVLPKLDPSMLERHPVSIIGEKLDERVSRLADGIPHVRMIGWVPSVTPYLQSARISVVPLRYGAGTKRKLLQSLMAGTPAVSTSVGVEGFALEAGRHVLVADEAEPFAQATSRLLQDDALWKKHSRLGRQQLSRNHQREAVFSRLHQVVSSVLGKPMATPSGAAGASENSPARLDLHQYAQLRNEILTVAQACLPQDAKVAVVSRGDDELLKLNGRPAWHLPQTPDGLYSGHHPADSAGAIAQLEALRHKGAGFLLLPGTAFWWLDHYREFRTHLETHYTEVVRRERVCVIYSLAPKSSNLNVQSLEQPRNPIAAPASSASRVRLVAFYLPQFHPIPENDAWWGPGFTEWTNVRSAKPLFPEHYQPHVPTDLGYYDLRSARVRQAQADLARLYGIYGFCYYHYWFGGKRLLQLPFDQVLSSRHPDFPFCLCWANEPWSRRWNGQPKDILQPQSYSPEDDLAHIRFLLPALADRRAIRIDGKPVLVIYQAQDLPRPHFTAELWRREVERSGLPGLYLMCVETGRDAGWDATKLGFDAKVLFQPQFTKLFNSGSEIPRADKSDLRVFDYGKAWPVISRPEPVSYDRYETVCPGWDNSPRTGEKGVVLSNSSPHEYEQWLRQAVGRAQQRGGDRQVVFLNAWNEWGEGCHLEPDARSGSAYLEATRRVLIHSAALAPLGTSPTSTRPAVSAQTPAEIQFRPQPPTAIAAADSAIHTQAFLQMQATARGETGPEYVPLSENAVQPNEVMAKLIAFYLPQFHAIPENDTWWGKGFTEWTNVSKAAPQFVGHYQPRLPGELGFYDLRLPEVQRRQVELARRYGVFGFCFYYYWFAGKRLLEKPLDQFISDPAIDFPFCLCWANENWTRRWDGKEAEILVAQNHCKETDLAFIRDIEPMLRHSNYIRIHGRPVLIVYRARLLPEPASTARRWRDYCLSRGLPEPYLIAAQVFEHIDPRDLGFDAAVEFPPNTPGLRKELHRELTLLNPEYDGTVYSYSSLAELTVGMPAPPYPLFRTVCPSWDNEPRRPGRGSTYAHSSPSQYRRWLEEACRCTLADPDSDKHLLFINAWNEWGEGAHLEPDRRYGYAYLQATADALRSVSGRRGGAAGDWTILFISHDANRAGAQLVLLNQLAWLKQHTCLRLKVLCLEGGEWLGRFQQLADTVLWSQLQATASAGSEPVLLDALLAFCGGPPQLIYGNSVASGRVYSLLRKLDVPIVSHVHELEMSIKRYAEPWIDDVRNSSAHFIACSRAVAENLVASHRIAPDKISTVYASIELAGNESLQTDDQRAQLKARLGFPLDKHLIVGCGLGMPYRKGVDLFVEVARSLHDQGRRDFHFYWIGELEWGTGPEADRLETLRKSAEAFVTFLGTRPDAKIFFRSADVFLLPSREDPFPLVALEAAACGLPIVCFEKAGGMPDFVEQDAGCVVPFADIKAMAAQVSSLIDSPPRRSTLGARAKEKMRAQYTIERTGPQVLSVCRGVAGRKPAVSIIVPNYNHGRYLPNRLDSIFRQTFKDFELILLDDHSSDDSLAILQQYAREPNVRLIQNSQNSGSTFKQWLKGIDLARADIIWIAESDDACEPNFLESLLPPLREAQVKLAYCNSHVIDEQGAVIGDYTACEYLTSLSPTKWKENYRRAAPEEINDGLGVKNTILSASSVVFKRFALSQAVRRELETLRLAGDWYFFVHAIAGGDVAYVSRKLNYHRRHSQSVIGRLLRENRVAEFFREFYTVQAAIISHYPLTGDFPRKWKACLYEQWQAFFPNRPFEELEQYYPVKRVSAELLKTNAAIMPAFSAGN